jgi:hypothetical protein
MCQDNCHCAIRRFVAHLKAGQAKRGELDGREYLIVPVVMARSDVVMNGGLIPLEEFHPASWNGRPVVINHPEGPRGGFIEAGRPDVHEQSTIGQIFNTRVDGNALKAEAWIDIDKADRVVPGLVEGLDSGGLELNVSTGYFADAEPKEGKEGGKRYKELHRNLKPDHLAFLPNDLGACSWEDGCGVRFNKETAMKFGEALKGVFNGDQIKALLAVINDAIKDGVKMVMNARGDDDDVRQMRADLISDDRSPFTPDDEMALQYMSAKALKSLQSQYLPKKGKRNASANEEDEPKEKDVDETKVKSMIDSALSPLTEAITKLTTNLADAVKANALSAEDKAALAIANKTAADHRTSLEDKIVANSAMTKEQLKDLPLATVEMIANGLKTPAVANFAARPAPRNNADQDDAAVKAMSENVGAVAFLNARKQKAA